MQIKTLFAACALGLVMTAAGCEGDKDSAKPTGDPTQPDDPTAKTPATGEQADVDVDALAAEIGVEPGGWEPEPDAGADAVLVAGYEGTVEVRRVGNDAFEAASGNEAVNLYAGDQVRTGDAGKAQVVLVDQTVVELADSTAIAIGDRDASADPASSAAVLYGVARFSVSPRGQGEGPFLVFTAAGIIGTKGTTYAVGVSASGEARVGVEQGEVEVVGAASLDTPVAVTAGNVTSLSTDGQVQEPEAFADDDWGEWRDEAEAELEPEVVVEAHAGALSALEAEAGVEYTELDKLATTASELSAEAETLEESGDEKEYEVSAEARASAIEASFATSTRLQHHTYAMLSHAYLANEIHVRHPAKTKRVYVKAAPRVHGAILYHKKYHATVHHRVKPLRGNYYVHHPRGRANAPAVSVEVPAFYAKAKVKPVKRDAVVKWSARPLYRPPVVKVRAKNKRVWVSAPGVGWHAKAKVKPAKVRKATWYARPKTRKGRVVAGVKVKGPRGPVFKVKTRKRKGATVVKIGGRGISGVKVKTPGGRGKVKVGGKGGVKVKVPGGVGVGVKGGKKGVKVKVPGGIGVGVKRKGGKGGVKIKGGGGISIGVKKGKRKRKKDKRKK